MGSTHIVPACNIQMTCRRKVATVMVANKNRVLRATKLNLYTSVPEGMAVYRRASVGLIASEPCTSVTYAKNTTAKGIVVANCFMQLHF